MYRIPSYLPRSQFLRPQKTVQKLTSLEKISVWLSGVFALPWLRRIHPYTKILPAIHSYSALSSTYDDDELIARAKTLGTSLRRDGFESEHVAETFSLIREAAKRSLGLSHFDSQLLGGLALFYGNIAEMQTGEGKTLTATLPAAAAALAGIPVHVITVNDYLAKRDANEMLPVYARLGLTVGSITNGMSLSERQDAYGCDIVYCTNNEIVFDYLKDQISLKTKKSAFQLHAERLKGNNEAAADVMLSGLHFAIVDEADSVFMDEAVTPLIISATIQGNEEEVLVYRQALDIAKSFINERDYTLNLFERKIVLTKDGEEKAQRVCNALGPFWRGRARRIELINKALSALFLFKRDQHYLVRDEKIEIIDEHTGRVMPDRSWEKGLHQLIEIKEECEVSAPRETLEKISYQRFFRMYHHLAGMTGTASEVSAELWSIYKLPVIKIPTNKPSRRQDLGIKLFGTNEEKWTEVVKSLLYYFKQGRSVLVGAGSVDSSEQLSRRLNEHNIPHAILNARQDSEEANIIANAGCAGQITIATSMAGRGTDIKIDDACASNGGLHVLLTELHESSRIDRQLEGRCARMGDCGSIETIVALDDSIMKANDGFAPRLLYRFLQITGFNEAFGVWFMKRMQKSIEKRHEKVRMQLLRYDEQNDERLAFSGKPL